MVAFTLAIWSLSAHQAHKIYGTGNKGGENMNHKGKEVGGI
jgi:hypothetical protein